MDALLHQGLVDTAEFEIDFQNQVRTILLLLAACPTLQLGNMGADCLNSYTLLDSMPKVRRLEGPPNLRSAMDLIRA